MPLLHDVWICTELIEAVPDAERTRFLAVNIVGQIVKEIEVLARSNGLKRYHVNQFMSRLAWYAKHQDETRAAMQYLADGDHMDDICQSIQCIKAGMLLFAPEKILIDINQDLANGVLSDRFEAIVGALARLQVPDV